MKKALVVGGCTMPWHRIESAGPPIVKQLETAGFQVSLKGIFHPDGGDSWTGDYSSLTLKALQEFDLLVLMTTDDDCHGAIPADICTWVELGGALAAIHGATASFRDNDTYIQMLGAAFRHHPPQLTYTIQPTFTQHEITKGVPSFSCFDELYLFERYDESTLTLLAETEAYEDEGRVPILWIKEIGKGRMFYMAPGHNPETMELPEWQTMFSRAVGWCLQEVQ